ncbi:nucleoside hydrolase-like domain-containing protein [Massilia niabensis]|uniref:Nucleoside hydrolase-like domain-containing protein n=1 Tax=Massilia niabensis TaxID=544910 RepID=A0ABW0L4E9_9BURK
MQMLEKIDWLRWGQTAIVAPSSGVLDRIPIINGAKSMNIRGNAILLLAHVTRGIDRLPAAAVSMLQCCTLPLLLLASAAIAAPAASSAPGQAAANPVAPKPRLMVLTDIENEPDDAMSLVRLLVYANQFDIEGLAATTSVHQPGRVAPERITRIVTAYGKVRDNLQLHEPGFPTGAALLGKVSAGLPLLGMQGVGDGKDSPASEQLIRAVDSEDPRPLWVSVWGGPNVLAQALWKVRATRTPQAQARFIARLRVYAISGQDDTGPWLRQNFPGLHYIVSPGVDMAGAYHHATWSGISGDDFHGRFAGGDASVVSNQWLGWSVRRKGPLGAEYPQWEYLMEGDTPSFLNLISNGLSDPERPDWGGWGGRYELYTPRKQRWFTQEETRPIWTDAQDEVLGNDGKWHTSNHATVWRWRGAFQNDFAARMDWTIKPYSGANHPPLPALGHPDRITAKRGQRVDLSAVGSSDPDGDALSYNWFYYPEPGTFVVSSAISGQPLKINGSDQQKAFFIVPTGRVRPPGTGTIHIILALTDHGTPRLTRYKRVIVDVVQ